MPPARAGVAKLYSTAEVDRTYVLKPAGARHPTAAPGTLGCPPRAGGGGFPRRVSQEFPVHRGKKFTGACEGLSPSKPEP